MRVEVEAEVEKGSKEAGWGTGAAGMAWGSLNLDGVVGGRREAEPLVASSSKPPRRSVVAEAAALALLGVVAGDESMPPAGTAPPMQYGWVSKLWIAVGRK